MAPLSGLRGDLRDPQSARRAVEGVGAIVHLAPHPTAWTKDAGESDLLDLAGRGTYVLLTAAEAAGVERVVLASTLDLMEAYPPGWQVDEGWRPRPGTDARELVPYVAELSARELARTATLTVVCLRLGRLVDDAIVRTQPPDSRWQHVDDAVAAVGRALAFRPPRRGWWVFHVPGGGRARFPLAAAIESSFGYAPRHDFGGFPAPPEPRLATVDASGALAPLRPLPPRPIRRVAVLGACGPLAAAATPLLGPSYTLRLTDVLSPEEGAARIAARFPGAPHPASPGAPHEFRHVDVSDAGQVAGAAQGMDALVNCTVVREDLAGAFRVNLLGAYHVLRAAVAQGIRRVVHTGPQTLHFEHPAGYGTDFDVPDEAPPRPGDNLYFHSKLLGLELARVFAHNHGLEVAALLFSTFVNPAYPEGMRGRLGPAAVSWQDAGHAMRRALEVPALPSSFEAIRILGDLPHAKFTNAKARRILGWMPRDSLLHFWDTSSRLDGPPAPRR